MQPAEPRIDPRIESDLTDDAATAPRAPPPRQSVWAWLLIVLVAAAVGAAVWIWLRNQPPPSPPAVARSEEAPPPAPAPEIRHPIEEAQAGAEPYKDMKPLPALATSDTTMQNTLAELFGASALDKIFFTDAIVHRFVTTVDNLPRKALPTQYVPFRPTTGPMITAGKDEKLSIGAENAARYAPYAQMADAIDAKKLVAVYVHFYPLLQEDYRNLGYPKGYFNDRLVDAIDDMLAAPDVPAPVALVQPKVVYQYADADLESRSAGQKIMMRMGAENAVRIKAKLREIRSELTSARQEIRRP